MNNDPKLFDSREKTADNQRWIVWSVGLAALMVLLFICGIVGVITYGRLQERGIVGGNNDEPQTVIITVPTPEGGADDDVQVTVAEPTATNETSLIPTATLSEDGAAATPTALNTPNIAPTATAIPIPTNTIPPNGSVTAPRVDTPFVIDGDLDGWSSIPSYNSTFRVFASAGWDGTDDSDAFWRLAWDENNLYVAVLVTDDTHVQTQTGNQIFRGDSLEMQIDTDRDADYGAGLSPDDFQLVLSPGNFGDIGPSAFRFRALANGQMRDALGHGIQVRSQQLDNGYVLEASIPWQDLSVSPVDGKLMGITLNVNDNDAPGTAQQETLKSHVASRTYSDPTTWGLLILSE